ncbi:WXG100 family type VII secretion target [Nocardia xishanensis]|uniref:WXG100 family type VII secretion target n=1 Tax=Nocardia xishanensis TaxID=238964 RepID=UPI000830742C|nr:WXG100 family type VII secretion target [Nocardia xishanensis]
MTSYNVDTERVLALVEKARQIGQQIEQRIADVEREVAGLHIEWEGDAAAAHRSKHDTWQSEMQDMKSALAELETAARAAHDRYVANVEHNKGMWP